VSVVGWRRGRKEEGGSRIWVMRLPEGEEVTAPLSGGMRRLRGGTGRERRWCGWFKSGRRRRRGRPAGGGCNDGHFPASSFGGIRREMRKEEDNGGYGIFRLKSSTGGGERRGARGRGKGKGRLGQGFGGDSGDWQWCYFAGVVGVGVRWMFSSGGKVRGDGGYGVFPGCWSRCSPENCVRREEMEREVILVVFHRGRRGHCGWVVVGWRGRERGRGKWWLGSGR
ncbi:hypothetical protein HAX54_051374, partial [Datura stramonium]|nr:hypothetical protein [Datura stramonium]